MKIFGSVSELVKIVFRKSTRAITVEPAAQTTGDATITIPDMAGVSQQVVLADQTQTLTNKSLKDNTTAIVDSSDATKQIKFDAAGSTGTSTTLSSSQTANRVLTLPDETGTVATQAHVSTGLAGKQPLDAELTAIAGLTSAADKLPYFTGSETAGLADFTAAGRALLDDASAAAQRTTLGLGDIATQNASGVAITGGSITGITDLAVADGGTGSSTASGARTNLGAAASGANSDITSLDSVNLRGMKWNDTSPVDISSGTLALTANTTVYQITTGGTLGTITGGSDGLVIALQNNTASSCTITNDSSTTDNRILTGTGNNLTLTAGATILLRFEASAVGSQADNKWYVVGGSGSSSAASGSGEVNAVLNPSAASDLTGYSVTGTATVTRLTSGSPLDPATTTALRFGSGAAADYVYYNFTLPAALVSKKLKIEWHQLAPTSGQWKVEMRTQAGVEYALSTDSSGDSLIPAAAGKFTTYFDADTTTTLQLRFVRVTGSGNLDVTNIIVGPGIQPQGAVVGPPIAYTPTFSAGWGSVTSIAFRYTRIGEYMRIEGKFSSGTVAGTAGTISLPSGHTIGTTLTGNVVWGSGWREVSTGSSPKRWVLHAANGATVLSVSLDDYTIAISPTQARNANDVSGNTETHNISVLIPIAEWAGSGTVNLAQNDVEYASNSDTSDGNNTSAFAYGSSGSVVPTIVSTAGSLSRDKTVRFQTPILPTDEITLEIQELGTGAWIPIDSQQSYSSFDFQGATAYGIAFEYVNSTDIKVMFFRGGRIASNATYAQAGASYPRNGTDRWRVKKSSGGQAVGFGMATSTQSGLVSTTTQTFAGIKNNASMPACSVDATTALTYNLNGGFVDATWRESGGSNTFDQGGVFTTGTTSASPTAGIFTCPTGGDGTYLISAVAKWAGANIVAGGRYLMRVYKNGTILVDNDIYAHTAGRVSISTRTVVCQLVASDIIYARFLSDQNHTVSTVTISGDETLLSIAKLY